MTEPARDDWLELLARPLPVDAASEWVIRPNCGARVVFTGVARDFGYTADGRATADVSALEYEAYEAPALRTMAEIARDARVRYPSVERIALLHRVGRVELSDAAVVVAVSSPHRSDAFDAARQLIDEVKLQLPVWKRELWPGGSDWSAANETSPMAMATFEGRSPGT